MNTTTYHQHPVFNTFTLGKHALSNRLAVSPMTRNSATSEGVPTADMAAYYEAFAAGGFSIIISEGIYPDTFAGQTNPRQPGLVNEAQVAGWNRVVQKVKAHGTVFIAQLMHAGALSEMPSGAKAPSAVQPLGTRTGAAGSPEPFPIPAAMTREDIQQAVTGFVQAAVAAQRAGFDGVEIHGANGYLPDQFITPHLNIRTDEYGGTVPNRFRIIAEIITRIRAATGNDFIVGLRLSEGKVNDLAYRMPGGAAVATEILTEAARYPFTYIHIAAEGGIWARECSYPDGTSYSGLAKTITGLPVIANGGMHNMDISADIISNGHGDLVSIGRAAIADPSWPVTVKAGLQPVAFHPDMIKPHITLAHTRQFFERNTLHA